MRQAFTPDADPRKIPTLSYPAVAHSDTPAQIWKIGSPVLLL
jgi:hypothetical protein